jgi:hypothetical protein
MVLFLSTQEVTHMVDRRSFLFGAGAAILAAPTLSTLSRPDISILNPFNFLPSTGPYPVNRTLDRMLREARAGNRFVARADTLARVRPMRLLPSTDAVRSIFDSLGLNWNFSDRVCYCEAAQCKDQFRAHEQRLRRRFNSFAGVQRAPDDRDVAYLAALDSAEPAAAAATQFRGHDSVSMSGVAPGVINAASTLFKRKFQPNSQEAAQSLAVTSIEDWAEEEDGPVVGKRYETPVISVIHDQRRYEDGPQGYLIARNNLGDDDVAYYGGLYS